MFTRYTRVYVYKVYRVICVLGIQRYICTRYTRVYVYKVYRGMYYIYISMFMFKVYKSICVVCTLYKVYKGLCSRYTRVGICVLGIQGFIF